MKRPAPFLPHPAHVTYVLELLTLVALLAGAYLVLRDRRDSQPDHPFA